MGLESFGGICGGRISSRLPTGRMATEVGHSSYNMEAYADISLDNHDAEIL